MATLADTPALETGPPASPVTPTKRTRRPAAHWRPRTVGQWVILILCVLLLIYFAFPVYVIITTALKGPGAEGGSLGLPSSIDLSGFNLAWGQLKGNLWNSVQIAVPGTVISCFLGALNGFVLAKSPFRGAAVLFILMMVGMFIPFQAVIIPLFVFLKALGLQGTLIGIVCVHVIYGLPFATLIMRNYYETIPDAIVEAAAVDGCGLLRTFFRVMIPLSIPGFVVAGIFQFTNIWNDFLFGLIVTSQQTWPVTVRLNNLLGDTSVDYGTLMGGALMVAAPTVLVYIALGRYFIGGLTAGSGEVTDSVPVPAEPFTFGLVGASNMAMTWMLPALRALGLGVHGLYDNQPHRFRYWADADVGGVTVKLDEVLVGDVDAVYISTRNDQHRADTIAAAEAGKHVLVEKPIALTVADAQAMIDAAEANGVVLAVNHHLTASPLHVAARGLVAEGRIGQLVGARINHAVTLPTHLRGWRLSSEPGAGVILDLTVHDASVLNPLFGATPVAVTALGATQAPWNTSAATDSVMSLFRYPAGPNRPEQLAFAHDSFTVGAPTTYLEILGDRGALIIRDAMNQLTAGALELHCDGTVTMIDVDCTEDLYQIVLRNFVAATRGEGEPTVTGQAALDNLRVALMVQHSVGDRNTVT